MPHPLAHRSRLALLAIAISALATPAISPAASPTAPGAPLTKQQSLNLLSFRGLMLDMANGNVPTDDRIKSLDLGGIEPLILAIAGFHRDLNTLGFRYQAQRRELNLAALLDVQNLATAPLRAATRAKIQLAARQLDQYDADATAALKRSELALIDAYAKTPANLGIPERVTTEPTARSRAYLRNTVAIEKQRQSEALAVVQLLDDHPDSFQASKDPKPVIQFRDETVRVEYAARVTRINELADRLNASTQHLRDKNDQAQRQLGANPPASESGK